MLDDDAIRLIEALEVGPTHLVGVSMGGAIAQSVALRRPDLVAALTLIATTAVGGVDFQGLPAPAPEVSARFENPPPDPDWADRERVVDWFLDGERAFAGSAHVDDARVRAIAGEVFDRSVDVAAAGNHWLVVGDGEEEPLDVREITAPTLVVHGTLDPLFPLPHGEALAASIPGARLLRVDGMGHQVPPQRIWPEFVGAVLALGQSRSKGSA